MVSNPATVTIDYPQDKPVASNDTQPGTAVGGIAQPVTVNVLTNDNDSNNNLDPTSVQIVGSTDGKTLVVNGEGTWTVDPVTGNITFTPDTSFKGDPTPISYTVKDSTGLVSNPATVTIDYPQDKPVATNDTQAGTAVGGIAQPVTVNVLTNDSDPNNNLDPTSVVITQAPAGSTIAADGKSVVVNGEGTWTVDPVTGNITFTPDTSFKGDPTPISYTVKDSTGLVSNPATVTVVYPVPPKNFVVQDVRLSEEGLAGGQKDNLPDTTFDTTDSTKLTKLMTFSDVDSSSPSAFNITLAAPTATIKSGGIDLVWNWNATDKTLIATKTANGTTQEIIKIAVGSVNSLGGDNYDVPYTVELKGAVDHPVNSIEDILDFNITASLSDDSGAAPITQSFKVTIEDDSPSSFGALGNAAIKPVDTNLMLILDVSGSMDTKTASGKTRLEALKEAVTVALNKYDEYGDVKVRLITFSTEAKAYGLTWLDIGSAKAIINSLLASGVTNYDAALGTAISAYSDPGKLDPVAGSTLSNVCLFISDGDPTAALGDETKFTGNLVVDTGIPSTNPDMGIQGADAPGSELYLWREFLRNNDIKSRSIGIGNAITKPAMLTPIAYDGLTNQPLSEEIITDPNKLAEALLKDIQPAKATGGLLAGVLSNPQGGFGADNGYISEVKVDGYSYQYNRATNSLVSTQTNTSVYSFDLATHILSVKTVSGGLLSLDFDNANYSYQTVGTITTEYKENITYSTQDYDGDALDNTLTLNIYPFEARNDIVLTNQTGTVKIRQSLLTANDEFLSSATATISALSNVENGTAVLSDPLEFTLVSAPASSTYSIVPESTINNDTIANAQNILRSSFGLVPSTTTPATDASYVTDRAANSVKVSASVSSTTDVDFYKVTLKAGETFTVDIDCLGKTGNVDTKVWLLDANGAVIDENDNKSGSADAGSLTLGSSGSTYVADSYLTYKITTDGDYYVKVGNSPNAAGSGDYDLWLSIDKPFISNFDYTLSENGYIDIGNVIVKQTVGSNILGTASDETLIGRDGADDVLNGSLGNDIMFGGTGSDQFVFNTTLGKDNIDTILDFVSGTDKIKLEGDAFLQFYGSSSLTSTDFNAGSNPAATTDSAAILYNTTTGALSYDENGNIDGATDAIIFAYLTTETGSHPNLAFTDFIITII